MIKRILFLTISIILFCIAFISAKPPETELMKAFINPHSETEKQIVKLANLSSHKVNLIFENDAQDFMPDFQQQTINVQKVTEVYKNYTGNFLTPQKRKLLQNKEYGILENQALEGLYNPLGFYIASPSQDPYLLATDFVLSKQTSETKEYNGKSYSILRLEVQNDNEVSELLNKIEGKNIYLTGTPIHSYITAQKSKSEINIICILSILVLGFLIKTVFNSYKIIIPITLSILFGFLCGYTVSALIFHKLHILTFVFSTSLIGISLDYSLHYFLTGDEKNFKKSLTSSMLTTVFAFWALIFSNIEILRQIAIFTSFGLIGVYLFVLLILPRFKNHYEFGTLPKIKISQKIFISTIFTVIAIGCLQINFDDNIKNLYTPPQKLLESESLYHKVFGTNENSFLIIKGKNTDEILEKSEKFENAFGLSSFVSSQKRQKENLKLVQELYNNDAKNFEQKLGTKFNLQASKIYDVEKFPLNSEFMLDKNTSFLIVSDKCDGAINISEEISNILKKLRIKCLKILPFMMLILFGVLSFIYGIKNAIRIIIPPACGILFTVSILSVFGINLNLFHILALFLIMGFSLDYSIFRLNGCEKSKTAVFISALSTIFSFGLLAFTSFKLISSLGTALAIGITVSYLLSLFMIKSSNEKN